MPKIDPRNTQANKTSFPQKVKNVLHFHNPSPPIVDHFNATHWQLSILSFFSIFTTIHFTTKGWRWLFQIYLTVFKNDVNITTVWASKSLLQGNASTRNNSLLNITSLHQPITSNPHADQWSLLSLSLILAGFEDGCKRGWPPHPNLLLPNAATNCWNTIFRVYTSSRFND